MTAINQLFSGRAGLGLALAGFVLAGCAHPTPYAPRLEGQQTGYTDRELAPGRYRVTFSGNTVTPRDTVESYLLLRAAEVTKAAGGTWFEFDTRNTKAQTSYQTIAPPPDPWFGPWYGRGFYRPPYWGGWGFAYEPSVDVVTRTKYDAYAEIVMLTPEQARSEPRAINADAVIQHLGPDAVPPDRRGSAPPPPPPVR